MLPTLAVINYFDIPLASSSFRSKTHEITMAPYYDGLLAFLFRQFFYTIPDAPPVELHGKSVLLTGANSGVGFCLALELASRGAKVLAAVRSVPKGEAAKQKILEQVPTAQVEVRECDLASFDSVKAFVNQISQEFKTFDLVILNAGVWCSQWMASADGFDLSLQVTVPKYIDTGLVH